MLYSSRDKKEVLKELAAGTVNFRIPNIYIV